MIKKNIFEGAPNSEVFIDDRGVIADVFYDSNLNHVAIVDSRSGAIRGNHFHLNSIQHILITSGSLEYWYANKENLGESKFVVARRGDLVTSSAGEVHALRILDDGCTFIAFTEGQRGGKDYESDTFRVENIIR